VLLCDEEADDEDCTIPEYQVTAPAVASIEKSGGDSGTYISRLADDTITTEGVREFLTLAFVPPMIPFLDFQRVAGIHSRQSVNNASRH